MSNPAIDSSSSKSQHNGADTTCGHQERKRGSDKVGLRERIKHFTWAWFTSTMSTGGLAIALAETPHRFKGLYTIGVIVFIFDLILFLLLCTAMIFRLIIAPHHVLKSVTTPPESFFFGSFLLSICTILGSIHLYSIQMHYTGVWLLDTIRVLYWMYASTAIICAISQYWLFIKRNPQVPIPMSPEWFLPGYSAMLTGTLAALISGSQPPAHRLPIIVSGLAYQGFGWLWSSILIILYVKRLMEEGLSPPSVRPGMFIPVGTAAYTIIALIGQAQSIPRDYGYFATHPNAADILQTTSLFIGIFLWVFAFWLFSIAVLGCIQAIPNMGFKLSWWAFIFPNVGFTVATVMIGRELESEGILWVSSVMTILLVAIWLFTLAMCVKAVMKKEIMWPGKDEDKDI